MIKQLLFPVFLFSSFATADFNTALDAYESGQYTAAYNEFLTMAQSGEKRSQFNLGIMYYQGQHVNKDINKAYAWLKLATEGATTGGSEQSIFLKVASEVNNMSLAEQEYQNLSANYSTQVLIKRLYPEFGDTTQTNSFYAKPLKIIPPKYPKKAVRKGIQGWTRFVFDLDKLGIPRNIRLIESVPEFTFAKESRKVISKWRFKPALDKNGKPIPQSRIYYTMQFQLAGSGGISLKKGIFEDYLKKALKGDSNAQFNVGLLEKKLQITDGKENPNKWFLKAAMQDHPKAQFELGRSLIYGQGCKLDKAKGIEWLTRSAHSGWSEAKQLLATVASHVNKLESHKKAIEFLDGVEDMSASTKINYAWMLAISPFKEISNPKKSLEIIDDIPRKAFKDDITRYEIKAAAYAAMGDFEEAIELQEEALKEAEDRGADIEKILAHLSSYKNNQRWF